MNTKDNIMKRWWQVLSLLLMCFVGGSGTAWGEASFGEYCSIKQVQVLLLLLFKCCFLYTRSSICVHSAIRCCVAVAKKEIGNGFASVLANLSLEGIKCLSHR